MVFIKKTFIQQRVPKGYGNKEGNVQLGSKKRAFQYEYVWECATELRREKERKCVCVCVQEGYTINTVTMKCIVTYSLLF